MIYNENYQVKFYCDSRTGREPVLEYIQSLDLKTKEKVNKYLELLEEQNGYLDQPYSRHIIHKIRELRVDFFNDFHRIFYFSFVNKKIILLHAFRKKTRNTPRKEIKLAELRYQDSINNPKLYE